MTARVSAIALLALLTPVVVADEPKPKPPAPPANKPDDAELEKLRAAIAADMQAVDKKLQEKDAGDDTRSIQKRILENLDKLLKQAHNPPPPQNDQSQKSDSQPMGGQSQPQPGGEGKMSRRERRERQRQQQQSRSGGKPQPGGRQGGQQPQPGGDGPAQRVPTSTEPRPDAKTEMIAGAMKDLWGHLPETMRQEIDRYYRVQFMPRYRDLVEQYYLRLAETDRRKKD